MKKAMMLGLLGLAVLVVALSGTSAYIYYDNSPYYIENSVPYYGGYYTYQDYSPDYYYNGYSPWNNAAYYPTYSYNNPTKVISFRDNPYYAYHLGSSYASYDYHPNYGAVISVSAHGCNYCDYDYKDERERYYFVRDTFKDYEDFRYNTYGARTGDIYGDDGKDVPDSNWRNKEAYDYDDYSNRDYSKYLYGDTEARDPLVYRWGKKVVDPFVGDKVGKKLKNYFDVEFDVKNREHYTDDYYYEPRKNEDGTYNWRY